MQQVNLVSLFSFNGESRKLMSRSWRCQDDRAEEPGLLGSRFRDPICHMPYLICHISYEIWHILAFPLSRPSRFASTHRLTSHAFDDGRDRLAASDAERDQRRTQASAFEFVNRRSEK